MDFSISWEFCIALLAAFILGASKSGLKGLGIVVVALMAIVYGAKASTGIIVPLFIVGDIIAVRYYNRFAKWEYLWKFLPAMAIGVIVATYFGKDIPETVFKKWMSIVILVSVLMMFWRDYYGDNLKMPKHIAFAGGLGFISGFTTMLGNLAGAFSNLFFLATGIPKNEIIGTAAWLFLIINIFKIPFHYFVWKTISMESLKINLLLVPAVLLGFWLGSKIVSRLSEAFYRKFLLIVTALGAFIILLK